MSVQMAAAVTMLEGMAAEELEIRTEMEVELPENREGDDLQSSCWCLSMTRIQTILSSSKP